MIPVRCARPVIVTDLGKSRHVDKLLYNFNNLIAFHLFIVLVVRVRRRQSHVAIIAAPARHHRYRRQSPMVVCLGVRQLRRRFAVAPVLALTNIARQKCVI